MRDTVLGAELIISFDLAFCVREVHEHAEMLVTSCRDADQFRVQFVSFVLVTARQNVFRSSGMESKWLTGESQTCIGFTTQIRSIFLDV